MPGNVNIHYASYLMRYVVRTGCTWRYLPHDLPPWAACYQQWARWRDARVFEALTDDLRQLLRLNSERPATPSAIILDSHTLQSTPESGHRAGYDGAKRPQRQQGARGRGHAGPPAGCPHHASQWAKPRLGRGACAASTSWLRPAGYARLCRLRLHGGCTLETAAAQGIQLQVVELG